MIATLSTDNQGVTSFYEEDLAYVHHVGFSNFANGAGVEILRLLQAAGIHSGLVADLACGSGVWAGKLIRNGYEVMGVDVSPSMIGLARKTAPQAKFQVGSLYDITLGHCAAVTILGEGLNYAVDGEHSLALIDSLFQKVAVSLEAGGVLAFDIVMQDKSSPMQYRSWHKGPDWAVLTEISEHTQSNWLMRDITVFRKVREFYRRSEERHGVFVLRESEVTGLLTAAGFEVSVSSGYGGYRLAPRRMAFVARRKEE